MRHVSTHSALTIVPTALLLHTVDAAVAHMQATTLRAHRAPTPPRAGPLCRHLRTSGGQGQGRLADGLRFPMRCTTCLHLLPHTQGACMAQAHSWQPVVTGQVRLLSITCTARLP